MEKQKKQFKPFKSCTVRMSDSTWKILKTQKLKTGLSWNKFIGELLKKK